VIRRLLDAILLMTSDAALARPRLERIGGPKPFGFLQMPSNPLSSVSDAIIRGISLSIGDFSR
jgi:hypothetical protein